MTQAHLRPVVAVAVAILFAAGLAAAGLGALVAVLVVQLVWAPFVFMLVRRPVLRRLAVRNASRRPRETALVLLGSMLGTAIITGSLIVGDTLDASIRRSAFTQLGPIDEIVRVPDAGRVAEIDRAARTLPDSLIDGVLPLSFTGAAIVAPGQAGRAEPHASIIEIDVEDGRAFGGDPGATGLVDVVQPGPGEGVLGDDLVETLGIGTGATVDAYAYGQKLTLRVVDTMPRLGVAGVTLGFGSRSPNLLVGPGTIASLEARRPPNAAPPVRWVAVSNAGGVLDGAQRSRAVSAALESALADPLLSVDDTKADLIRRAESQGAQFTQLFGGIGAFSVLAGILLLVNIFVMLAQERKTELGMLRAVGLRRASLVGTFTLEGWLYGIASAALGTFAGIGVGRVIVAVAADIFGAGGSQFGLELHYAATGGSIRTGFMAGFFISLVTVVITSVGISRLNVIRAIRDLPDPTGRRPGRASMVLGGVAVAVGVMMTGAGIAGAAGVPTLLGPGIAAVGTVLLFRRVAPMRTLVSVAAVATLLWAVGAFDVVPEAFRGADIPLFVVQGVMLTASAVALISQNQETIGAIVRRAGGGSRSMALRLGLAYPLARRFRTGMTLTMYSLVVFTLTFITVFSHLFGGQIDDFTREIAGGFDLRMSSNPSNPVEPALVAARPGVSSVAAITSVGAEFKTAAKPAFQGWGVGTFDETFVNEGPPSLSDRGDHATDVDAYRAVMGDPTLIIPTQFFLEEGGGGPPGPPLRTGDRVSMRDPVSGQERELTVAAVARSGFGNSLPFVSPLTMRAVFGDRPATDSLYIATQTGSDVERLAAELNAAFLANGADATSFREQINENLSQQQQFFRLMQGYLALGLLVGIAGLGVVMIRAVRERRRQVGVLRSLGFESKAIRRAFVAESAFVALEGIAVGMGLALVTSWRMIGNDRFGEGLAFSVPWAALLFLIALTFGASLLATIAPAQQASRIRPAVALRITD